MTNHVLGLVILEGAYLLMEFVYAIAEVLRSRLSSAAKCESLHVTSNHDQNSPCLNETEAVAYDSLLLLEPNVRENLQD